jgi:hypothetical protein
MINALKSAALVRLLLVIAIFSLSYWSISRADDDKPLDFESALAILEEAEGPEAAHLLSDLYREGRGFEWNRNL